MCSKLGDERQQPPWLISYKDMSGSKNPEKLEVYVTKMTSIQLKNWKKILSVPSVSIDSFSIDPAHG